jgi:hypothetical protein
MMLRTTLFLAALVLTTVPALAQNNVQPQIPKAPSPTAPPEKIAPADGGDTSNRLPQQKSSIVPPNVDPKMNIIPPRGDSGTKTVIPPPGTPGGDGSVVPK